ncbi:MAG: polysaccharide deacetylase family protein [Bacteroidota bacterium]
MSYTLKTLFNEGLGLDYHLVTDTEEFKSSTLPKLNYSASDNKDAFNIRPHPILLDYGIKDYPLEVISDPDFKKIFFKNGGGDLPFDLLGASFWLLARYEEYLPHKTDSFNRFHYRSSLAYQYDFIQLPLINLWLAELKRRLLQKFPGLDFKQRGYNFLSSVDIDNAYKYKYKGLVRTIAGFISDRSFQSMKARFNITFKNKKDPFDCYDFLIAAHRDNDIKAIYFFLLGDYGDNDKNHSSSNLNFQSLIKHLADYSMVGIHPSFGSKNNLHQLRVEASRLSNITHKVITKSRQHFSILKFPNTYRDLLQAGILADYSLGYTNFNGFRASYCYPFYWYSLDIESQSALQVHPFAITENTVALDAERDSKSFIETARPLIDEVKKYHGQLISIFHNDTFTEEMKKNYLAFLQMAKSGTSF